MNIGEKIKLLRKEKGLTQKELAEMIHKSEITVRKYEANDISMNVNVFIDILNALDSKLLIQSNDYCYDLLRQYIDSLDLDISEEMYAELETFMHHYVMLMCSPAYRHDIKNIKNLQALDKDKMNKINKK